MAGARLNRQLAQAEPECEVDEARVSERMYLRMEDSPYTSSTLGTLRQPSLPALRGGGGGSVDAVMRRESTVTRTKTGPRGSG